MQVLLIDNYDSFTYNLYQQVLRVGRSVCRANRPPPEVIVARNDVLLATQILNHNWDALIISPGPGHPRDTGQTSELFQRWVGRIPVLGVCLGHQFLAWYYGAQVRPALVPMHGKTCEVQHNASGLFDSIANPSVVTRYHSLLVEPDSLPNSFQVDALSKDREIMAISDRQKRLYGLQFHPESFLTQAGDKIIENFISLSFNSD